MKLPASFAHRGHHGRPVSRAAGRWRWLGRVLGPLALGIAAAAGPASPAPAGPSLIRIVSEVGLSRQAISRLNENDLRVAYRYLNAELGKRNGYDLITDVHVFDSPAEFAAAIRAGTVPFLILGTWEYLNLRVEDAADIEFSAISSGALAHRWLLLVRRDSGLKTTADLKGKNAILLANNECTLGGPWLETCLLEQGLGAPAQFFGSLVVVARPSAAVLPVFFGKAQACIVDQAAFAVMVEMNPQVGHLLEPLARSEPLLNGIVCFSRVGWPTVQTRIDMRKSLAELNLKPAGRQLLTLFKCDRLVPFDPVQLTSVRQLYARHQALLPHSVP